MSAPGGWRRVLTLRCEGASELASRELDEPLSRLERAALWGHLLACASCRRFRGQIRWLQAASRRRDRTPADEGTLSHEARRRIARAIDEASRDDPPTGPATRAPSG